LKPASIRIDETAEELVGPASGELSLPLIEHDRPIVFLAGAGLGEEARPAFPVGRDLDAVLRPQLDVCRATSDLSHRRGSAVNDSGVLNVEDDPEPVDAPWIRGDAAVAKIETKEVDILGRQLAERMLGSASRAAADRTDSWDRTREPIANRGSGDPQLPSDVRRVRTRLGELEGSTNRGFGVHLTIRCG
jgi:hypothetical protein